MRTIQEFVSGGCRVTVFAWNNRYIIKIEKEWYEQVYKIPQYDLVSEQQIEDILCPSFMQDVMERFRQMEDSLTRTLNEKLNPPA
jgi:hypothetical protein